MNIPEKVKIGWREYEVKIGDPKRNHDGNFLLGEIGYQDKTIYLNNTLDEGEKIVTLLHEIVHGIFYKQGHEEWRTNEELQNAISEGLYELILDNPEMFTDKYGCSK